jgi:ubiquinone/menaquinone biosynthesis C-methylase UbiE
MKTPRDLATAYTHSYVRDNLPSGVKGAKILEVGCGSGDLALLLLKDGAHITAIDSSSEAVEAACEKGVSAICSDFLSYKEGSFDALLFTRSLHHISPLAEVMQHAYGLLKPGGNLMIEDFDWDALDLKTARWFYGLADVLSAASLLEEGELTKHKSDVLSHWIETHRHEPALHRGNEMISAARKVFGIARDCDSPYLFRYFCRDLRSEAAVQVAQQVFNWEEEMIRSGDIQPVGIRVVATKRWN